jgi:lysine/arginine/ornithine transport system substrate-binding protein
MKKSLLLWVALMASASALAAEQKEIRFGVDPTLRRLNGKTRKLAGFD